MRSGWRGCVTLSRAAPAGDGWGVPPGVRPGGGETQGKAGSVSVTVKYVTVPVPGAGPATGDEGPASPLAVEQMLKRRLAAAGLPKILSPHSFRVLVVTDLLSQNVPLEDVQYLAGHAHPRTTQIYDRRRRRVSRNLVERISV